MGPTKWREGDRQRLRSTSRIDRACRTWSSGSDFSLFFYPIGGRADAVRGDGSYPPLSPCSADMRWRSGATGKVGTAPRGFVPLSPSVSLSAWALGSGYG